MLQVDPEHQNELPPLRDLESEILDYQRTDVEVISYIGETGNAKYPEEQFLLPGLFG